MYDDMETESYTGSNATGTSGSTNRVLTLSNTRRTIDDGFIVIVDTFSLHPTSDFTVSHQITSSEITFLNPLFDSQRITVHYTQSGLPEAGEAVSGILPLGDNLVNNEIDYFGTSVTLRTVNSTYNERGDPTETTSDSTKTAFIQILTQSDELVKEGIFRSGDKLFWFKGNDTNINRGNRIQHNGLWYEIVEEISHEVSGTNYVIEARTKKC